MSVNPAGFVGKVLRPGTINVPENKNPETWRKAKVFEAQFIANMMKHAQTGIGEGMFNDGFASKTWQGMFTKAQAASVVRRDGLGIAQEVYDSIENAGRTPTKNVEQGS